MIAPCHQFGAPKLNGPSPTKIRLSRATSKQTAVRELREQQELILSRLANPDLSDRDASSLHRSWVELRNQIRIEKGLIKPGSRNISVREPHPSELRQRQLTRANSSPEDLSALYHQHVASQPAPIVPPPPPATPQE